MFLLGAKNNYFPVSSDLDIATVLQILNTKDRIAVDFEGEFNLHVYGEHLCLIQIYDGEYFYIIDPRAPFVTKEGLRRFFLSPVKKLWFDCHSDLALVVKNYDCEINNIKDLREMALLLGYNSNLISLENEILGVNVLTNKKKNQQANWMRRPLDEELIEYALNDVRYLFELDDYLTKAIKEKKLEKVAESKLLKASKAKKPEPGWMRVGKWRHYTREQKIYLKNFFIARDTVAKRFNVPASRVLSKSRLIEYTINPPKNREQLNEELKKEDPRFVFFLSYAFYNAINKSREEINKES